MAATTSTTGRNSDKFMLRLPEGMRDRVAEAAKAHGRTMNAEIVHRLEKSFAAIQLVSTQTDAQPAQGLQIDVPAQFAINSYREDIAREEAALREWGRINDEAQAMRADEQNTPEAMRLYGDLASLASGRCREIEARLDALKTALAIVERYVK